MKPLWTVAVLTLMLLNITMIFELDSMNQKLDHLAMEHDHELKYAARKLEQAKLYEAQGALALAQTQFKLTTNTAKATIAHQALIGLNRVRIRLMLRDIGGANLETVKQLSVLIGSTPKLDSIWRKSINFVLALKQSDQEQAMALGKWLTEQPNCPASVIFEYAHLLLANKAFDQAQGLLKTFVETNPDSGAGWSNLGQFQRERGANGAALKSYLKALKLEPNQIDKLTTARIYMSLGQWKKASDLIDPSQFAAQNRNDALKLKAACLFQLADYKTSARLYHAANIVVPDPNTLLSKLIALQVAGDHQAALKTADEIVEHDQRLPQIHFHRGQLLVATGHTALASKAFVKFLKLANQRPAHKNKVKYATTWMKQYQRSLIVPKSFESQAQ